MTKKQKQDPKCTVITRVDLYMENLLWVLMSRRLTIIRIPIAHLPCAITMITLTPTNLE